MATRSNSFKERILNSVEAYNSIDIRTLLNDKGIVYTVHGDFFRMRCLFPDHDDRKPSFSIHSINYGYNCWGCNRTGTFRELAQELGWEIQKIGTVLTGIVQPYHWDDFKRNIRARYSGQEQECFPIPSGFTKFSDVDLSPGPKIHPWSRHWKYGRQRGIVGLFEEFKMGYTTQRDFKVDDNGESLYGSMYKDRILIPCHTASGKFAWMEGRSILKTDTAKYWRPKNVKRNQFLFNFHRVIRSHYRWVIVVEGILDAAILWSWGYPAVAVYGSYASPDQIEQLMYFDSIYMCFDNDKAGMEGYIKFKEQCMYTGVEIRHIILPPKQDALSVGREVFEKKFYSARKIHV